MNETPDHYYAHTGYTEQGEPPVDEDTALLKQDSKFRSWHSEAGHTITQSRRLPTTLTLSHNVPIVKVYP